MPAKELSDKPPKIIMAAKLFYLVIGIGMIRTTLTIIRHADVRSPHVLIIWKLVLYALCLFLIAQFGKGKNWARWSMAVMLALAFPLAIMPAFDVISHNPLQGLLVGIELVLYIIGLACLFNKSSSHWFNPRKVFEEQRR